jgi:hypothetical protein
MQQLRATGKEDLWKELFPDTPRGPYEMMWDTLELNLQRAAGAEVRQRERLRGLHTELPNVAELEADDAGPSIYGPDSFATAPQRLPKGYVVATKHAEAVLLDRMYLALEAHYDSVLAEEGRRASAEQSGDTPARAGPTRRPRAHRRGLQYVTEKRYGALEVPEELRTLLRRPQDETKWPILEELASALRRAVAAAPTLELQADIRKHLSVFGHDVLETTRSLQLCARDHVTGAVKAAAV